MLRVQPDGPDQPRPSLSSKYCTIYIDIDRISKYWSNIFNISRLPYINAGGDTAAQDSIVPTGTAHRHRPPPPASPTCSIMLGDARRLGRTLRLGVVAARGSWENSKDESERRAAQASAARTRA